MIGCLLEVVGAWNDKSRNSLATGFSETVLRLPDITLVSQWYSILKLAYTDIKSVSYKSRLDDLGARFRNDRYPCIAGCQTEFERAPGLQQAHLTFSSHTRSTRDACMACLAGKRLECRQTQGSHHCSRHVEVLILDLVKNQHLHLVHHTTYYCGCEWAETGCIAAFDTCIGDNGTAQHVTASHSAPFSALARRGVDLRDVGAISELRFGRSLM